MKMLTKEIEKKLPPLYSQEHVEDPLCRVKYFTPWSSWTWFGIEYDPIERIFFGYVEGQEKELGYFSLSNLECVKGPAGLKIERDLYFHPVPLSVIKTKSAKRAL